MKKILIILAAILGFSITANSQENNKKDMKTLVVNTFIEAHDLNGNTLNVFATSGGSGVEGSANDLKKAYPQYKWGESRLMN